MAANGCFVDARRVEPRLGCRAALGKFEGQLRVGQRQLGERSNRRKADPQIERPDSGRPRSAVIDPKGALEIRFAMLQSCRSTADFKDSFCKPDVARRRAPECRRHQFRPELRLNLAAVTETEGERNPTDQRSADTAIVSLAIHCRRIEHPITRFGVSVWPQLSEKQPSKVWKRR